MSLSCCTVWLVCCEEVCSTRLAYNTPRTTSHLWRKPGIPHRHQEDIGARTDPGRYMFVVLLDCCLIRTNSITKLNKSDKFERQKGKWKRGSPRKLQSTCRCWNSSWTRYGARLPGLQWEQIGRIDVAYVLSDASLADLLVANRVSEPIDELLSS